LQHRLEQGKLSKQTEQSLLLLYSKEAGVEDSDEAGSGGGGGGDDDDDDDDDDEDDRRTTTALSGGAATKTRETTTTTSTTRTTTAPGTGGLPRSAARRVLRATQLKGRAARLKAQQEADAGRAWRSFEDTLAVLRASGAVEEGMTPDGGVTLRNLGEVAREVRTENELWTALTLTSGAVRGLGPETLAGVLAALITADVVGGRPNVRCAYPPSEAVLDALDELEETRIFLEDLQLQVMPMDGGTDTPAAEAAARIDVDVRLVGLVEAWVAGATWDQISKDTSLDGGDIARLLSRVVDVLRQVAHCASLERELRTAARAAVKQMVRAPITDLLG
jgi:superfamily II RNA helicase